jgi:tetratricopeptide (TPR) repeat protein
MVLLTSREHPLDLAGTADPLGLPNPLMVKLVDLRAVDGASSLEILRRYGFTDAGEMQWIADRVQGHPFLLKLLAGYARYPGYLQKHPELLAGGAEQLLKQQLARQSKAARQLLQKMSVLRVPIDAAGLTFLRLNHGTIWTKDLRVVLKDWSQATFQPTEKDIQKTEDLLDRLAQASLVQKQYDTYRSAFTYDLHRVVVEFLQRELGEARGALLQSVYRFYRTGKTLNNPKTINDLQPLLEAQYFAFQLGNYSEAKTLIYQLEKYLEPWGYWTLLKDLCEQILPHLDRASQPYILQRIGSRYRDWGDWNQAERFYQQGLRLAEATGNRYLIAGLTGHLGDIERNRGNWEAAERLFRQSLELRTELGDRAGMAESWGLLGEIERKRGNWEAAERLYRQYLEVETELGDRAGMAAVWGVLGDIERKRGNWEAAERLYRQSLELRTELGDRAGMATSWGCLGEIERNRGNWEAAERLYRQSLELCTELGDRHGIAIAKGDFGDLELDRGNLDQAESFLTESLQEFEALKAQNEIAYVEFRLAQVWQKRGDLARAEPHRARAREIYQQLGAAKELERIETEWHQAP